MKKSELIFNVVLLPIDYIALVLAALTAHFLRFSPLAEIRPVFYEMPLFDFMKLVFIVALVWIVIFAVGGLYKIKINKKLLNEIGRVFLACSAGVMLVIIAIFVQRELFSSRFIILAAWLFAFLYVSIFRLAVILVQRFSFRLGYGVHRVAIIGADKNKNELTRELSFKKSLGYKVAASFDSFDGPTELQLLELARQNKIDEVILADPTLNKDTNLRLVEFTQENHLVFKYAADLFKTYAINVDVSMVAGIPVVELRRTPLDGWGRVAKRVLDILGASIMLILVSPVIAIVSLAIKLDSKGPVFFSKKPDGDKVFRVGQGGKLFHYFKFRSMVVDAEKLRNDQEFLKSQENLRQGTPLTKFKNDPRITRAGRLIRKFSIDELPEFFLVLIGKMSLVGPRPHLPDEVAKYQRHHKRVLDIKPGVTGMAQVLGRSDLDFEEEVRLDTYYIENWSLGLDLQILFKTPFILLKKRKAL